MYDLEAVRHFQHDLAASYGVDIGHAYGPWWNPPFYALAFVPLAKLSYPIALDTWLALNVLCAGVAVYLLVRMLPKGTPSHSWALVPVLIVLSTPFLLTMSHAQNTCTSLLILCATVTHWRKAGPRVAASGRPRVFSFAAGLIGGLLFYKPQLAAVLAVVIVLDLGWRAAAGFAITGAALLLMNVLALPGTLSLYVHQLPLNLHAVQVQSAYMWERHVTLKAFWRLLLQGRGPGELTILVKVLWIMTTAALGMWLLWQARRPDRIRDRLISATVIATPLLMPFYFDYDLLLLAVPAVLLGSELLHHDPRQTSQHSPHFLLVLWPVFFVALMLNADVAEKTRVNIAVPLLVSLASFSIARIRATVRTQDSCSETEHRSLAA